MMFRSTVDMVNHSLDLVEEWFGEYFFVKVTGIVLVLVVLTLFFGDAAGQLLTSSVTPEDQPIGMMAAILAFACGGFALLLTIIAVVSFRRR